MPISAGYPHGSRAPLAVSDCGTCKPKQTEPLPTWHKNGRLDYQLLYIFSGKCHFFFHGEERTADAGSMVLLSPRGEQCYEYRGEDRPEVFWVRFTGSDIRRILQNYQIPMDDPIFHAGVSSAYANLFREMIGELKGRRIGYEELLAMYLRQLFLLIRRTRQAVQPSVSTYAQEEVAYARRYFSEHYNEPISIQEYAESRNMSACYFQRSFKQLLGYTPLQYLLLIRIDNAASLLETTDYSMAEISVIVGYEDPLYFSRLFRKIKGMAPSEYRRLVRTKDSAPPRA